MRHRLLVSMVALIMTAMVNTTAEPASWEQNHGVGCDGYEGDHGRNCLPVTNDECEDGGWLPFDVFENLFENQGWCV